MSETTSKNSLNLIDEFVTIIQNWSDTPEVMLRSAAYFVISSTLGKYLTLEQLPAKFPRPNVFFVLGSDPYLTHRSTLESMVKTILRENFKDFNWDRYRKVPKKEKEEEEVIQSEFEAVPEEDELASDDDEKERFLVKEFDKHIVESGTPEGLVDRIQRYGYDQYLLIGSEYGEAFSQVTNQTHYMYGLITILDKLYYGESYSSVLSTRQGKGPRYFREGLYVTMFAAMQDMRLYLNEFMGRQGFLRRCILVPVFTEDLDERKRKPPVILGRESLWTRELPDFAKKLTEVERLLATNLATHRKISVIMFPSAEKKLNELAVSNDKRIIAQARQDRGASLHSFYFSSYWEQIIKLAALEAVSDLQSGNTPRIEDFGDQVVVNIYDEHIDKAISFLEGLHPAQMRVIDEIGGKEHKLPQDYNFEAKCQKLRDYLATASEDQSREWLCRKKIGRDYDAVISHLMSTNEVERKNRPRAGRPATILRLRESEG